jgi:hypothetical protein
MIIRQVAKQRVRMITHLVEATSEVGINVEIDVIWASGGMR